MSSFIYFFPTTEMLPAAETFERFGVKYACPPTIANQFRYGVTLDGPDGKSGVIYQQNATTKSLQYDKDKQRWKRIPNTDAYVGVWNDSPPKAESLIKSDAISGSYLPLGDGDRWLIPVARFECDNETTGYLTPQVDIDDFGNVVPGAFSPTQDKLNQMAERLANSFIAGFDKFVNEPTPNAHFQFDIDDHDPFDIIAANYRVSPAEIVLLNLFRWRDEAFKNVVKFFIDVDTYVQLYIKKKQSELSSTTDGEKANSPVINQP